MCLRCFNEKSDWICNFLDSSRDCSIYDFAKSVCSGDVYSLMFTDFI